MHTLIKRHVKVYFRDRWAVFFSLLSVLIILMLFALFLSNMIDNEVPEPFKGTSEANYLVYSWVFSGLLMVSSLTVPLGFLNIMVEDLESKKANDFYASPTRRTAIVLSYLIAAVFVTVLLNVINFAFGQVILLMQAGTMIPFMAMLKVFGLMLLSTLMFSAMMFAVLTFIKTQNAHGTLSTLVGTLIGFLGGLYVPPVALSTTINTVLNLLPPMQVAALFRRIYMAEAMDLVFPTQTLADTFRLNFGVDITVFNTMLPTWSLLLFMVFWTMLFTVFSIVRIKRFKRT